MTVRPQARKGLIIAILMALVAGGALLLLVARDDAAADLLSVVPNDAEALFFVPDAAEVGQYVEYVSEKLGVERYTEGFVDGMTRQLGFDLFDMDALRRRGISPSSGLLLYFPPRSLQGVVVLGMRDRGAFETALMELLTARTGAELGEPREISGVTVQVAERRGHLVAAWSHDSGAVFLSAGAGAAERVAGGAAREGALAEHVWFRRGMTAIGEEAHILAWSSKAGVGRFAKGAGRGAVDALALGLTLSDERLNARVWAGMEAPRRNALDPLKGTVDAAELVTRLDPAAPVAGRARVDLRVAWNMLRMGGLPRHLEELSAQLTARGIRLDRDLLPLLEGTFVADASLTGEPNFGDIGRMDPRRLNPFLYVRATVLAELTDPEKAAALLPEVAPAVARAVRGRLETVEIEGRTAYEVHYQLGRGMTFGVADGVLVVAGGDEAYARALGRLAAEPAGPAASLDDPAAVSRFASEGAAAMLVNVPNLLGAVDGLSTQAFGGGPSGMMMRSMVEQFLGPLGNLATVMTTLAVDTYGVVGTIDVVFDEHEPEVAAQ